MLKLTWKTCFCLLTSSVACAAYADTSHDLNTVSSYEMAPVCPEPGTWLNCMPSPGAEKRFYCRDEVRRWILENCEDVHYAY